MLHDCLRVGHDQRVEGDAFAAHHGRLEGVARAGAVFPADDARLEGRAAERLPILDLAAIEAAHLSQRQIGDPVARMNDNGDSVASKRHCPQSRGDLFAICLPGNRGKIDLARLAALAARPASRCPAPRSAHSGASAGRHPPVRAAPAPCSSSRRCGAWSAPRRQTAQPGNLRRPEPETRAGRTGSRGRGH